MRLGVGALGLYNLVGYLGDTLSYTRILALSLAGGVIATVVNAVAALVVATLGWAGYLVAVPVFVLGHAVNLCLSALGGFIHTARLHYVEWFGRFFDGGGRRFSPFRRQAQYVRLNQTTGATS
jgi:V/A-type H+-transporting ATPase subunit I